MSGKADADIAEGPVCPAPIGRRETIVLGHGGGGRLTRELVDEVFARAFANPALEALHDGAVLEVAAGRLAITTDTFVVSPLFFPGGDIGQLAVHGTVNDLAMCGAVPLALSAGFILEEGLHLDVLGRVVDSMSAAARAVPVAIVTGDTKVVERGKGDGVFINTTGVGLVRPGVTIDPRRAAPGDVVMVSGPIGAHGVAVMSLRHGLGLEVDVTSDTASVSAAVGALLAACGADVHVLRDPTRGGVATTLNEIAVAAGVGVRLDERRLPIPGPVHAACELLGLDPLYVANEGCFLAFVAPTRADEALDALRGVAVSARAAIIGRVTAEHPGRVVLDNAFGGSRILDVLSGEQLPRIC